MYFVFVAVFFVFYFNSYSLFYTACILLNARCGGAVCGVLVCFVCPCVVRVSWCMCALRLPNRRWDVPVVVCRPWLSATAQEDYRGGSI